MDTVEAHIIVQVISISKTARKFTKRTWITSKSINSIPSLQISSRSSKCLTAWHYPLYLDQIKTVCCFGRTDRDGEGCAHLRLDLQGQVSDEIFLSINEHQPRIREWMHKGPKKTLKDLNIESPLCLSLKRTMRETGREGGYWPSYEFGSMDKGPRAQRRREREIKIPARIEITPWWWLKVWSTSST